MNDTITKTGQDMPRKIVILDELNNTCIITSLPDNVGNEYGDVSDWVEEIYPVGSSFLYGDVNIIVEN